jgi:uncharacterized protein (TIGR02452 family)
MEKGEYALRKTQRRTKFDNKKKRPAVNRQLADVYTHTQQLSATLKSTQNARLYNVLELADVQPLPGRVPIVSVINADTLDAAEQGACVLNMASNFCPGGGAASGKTAQEECIFRRTTACVEHPRAWYPLQTEQVIYVPQVKVLKNSKYEMLKHPIDIALLTVPAIRKPKLFGQDYAKDEDRDMMRAKIDGIFKLAIAHGHDTLVLGALGCGIFKNPPQVVAQMFGDALRVYGGYFKKITFAVLVVKAKDEENLKEFAKILKK